MLSFFLFSSISTDSQCVAPRITPEPVNNMKIRYAQVLLRHGARAPLNALLPMNHRGYWTCDSDDAIAPRMHGAQRSDYRRFKHVLDPRLVAFLPNCRTGDLLLEGMEQHKRLGEMYADYFDSIGLFDQYPKDEEIHARCSNIERTLRSAQSFLHGFYPPGQPNTTLTIETGSDEYSLLRPGNFCKDMENESTVWAASEDYKKFVADNWPAVADFAEKIKVEQSGDNLNLICDYIATHFCDGKQISPEITDETINTCRKALGFNLYDRYSKNPFVYASYTMREILNIANAALAGNNTYKFTVNSAHDSTVAAIYQYLAGQVNVRAPNSDFIPPYASHLLMEIWDDSNNEHYVRFVFNGEIVKLSLLQN